MNFTLDDTSPDLAYSPGWAVQSPTDPSLSRFFQGTYHTPQIDGATVNFTFTGNAVALYGTTGPTHANFSVQFDSSIINLSAYTPQQQYQQVLFQRTFGPSSQTSQHFIQLTAVLDGQGVLGRWLDLDYVLFTDGSATATSTFPPGSIQPPWETTPVVPSGPHISIFGGGGGGFTASVHPTSPSASASASASATSSSKSSRTAVALAATFGALIGFALLLLLIWYVLRRAYDARRARERRFRYGTPGPSSTRSLPRRSTTTPTPTALGARGTPSRMGFVTGAPGILSALRLGGHTKAGSIGGTVISTSVYSHVPPGSPGLGSFEGVGVAVGTVEGVAVSVSVREREDAGSITNTSAGPGQTVGTSPGVAGRLLRDSPLIFGKKGKKDDGDSLRTDFLQV